MVVDVFCSSGAPAVMSCPKTLKAPSCTFRPREHAPLCLHELHGVLEGASPACRVCTRTWAFKSRSTSVRSDRRLPLEILSRVRPIPKRRRVCLDVQEHRAARTLELPVAWKLNCGRLAKPCVCHGNVVEAELANEK